MMSAKIKEKDYKVSNVILISKYLEQKEKYETDAKLTLQEVEARFGLVKEFYYDMGELFGSIDEVLASKASEINDNENAYISKIKLLKNENELLEMKLEKCLPNITIIYLVGSSMALAFFATMFFITVVKKVYIIHPFVSFVSAIGALGLLITSIASIKDWKEYLKNVQ